MGLMATRYRLGIVLAAGVVAAVAAAGLWGCDSAEGTQPLPPPAEGSARITLDGSTRYQTIDGWAVMPRLWEEDKENNRFDRSFEPVAEPVSRFLVDQMGINAVRLEIPSGMENRTNRWALFYSGQISYLEYHKYRFEKVNDNGDPRTADLSGFRFEMFDWRFETLVLPLKRALEARGEKLHVNLCYVDFARDAGSAGSLSHAQNPDEFAEFVLVYFEHLRSKYNLTPESFEVILEPENTEAWRGPSIGRALVAVSDRLRERGFTPEIIAPSNTAMSNAVTYFDEMIKIPGALARLHTFAYHRYWTENLSDLEAIRSRAQVHGLKTAMLEKVDAGIDALLEDLTVGQVSSWQQWAVAGNIKNADNGAYYLRVDASTPANPVISMAKHNDQLAQVFLYVRRGAVRIKSQSNKPDQASVAFINPNGTWVVVVRAREADSELTVRGLPGGRYGLRFTSDTHARLDPAPITISQGGLLTTQIPGAGVITIYGLGSAVH